MPHVPTGKVTPTGRSALVLSGVAATSAAGLCFEIALTRVFAVTQFYHFAFLAVSLALLGFGASGSALSVLPRLGGGGPLRWAWLAVAQSLTIIGAYAVTNALPFDSFAIAWDGRQVVYLVVYYLVLAVPFFFGGLIVAVLLAGRDLPVPIASHRVYAASLVGSGVGAILALGGVATVGGEAIVILSGALAMAGALVFSLGRRGSRLFPTGTGLATVALLVMTGAPPELFDMQLSPYKDLSAALRYPGAEVAARRWDEGTRLDLVVSEGIRSLPGLSIAYRGPLPRQDGITFNGDDLSPVPRPSSDPPGYASHLLSSLAFRLHPDGDALVLGPRGGLDVEIALAAGAGSVLAVEPLGLAVDMVRTTGPNIYDDPRVAVTESDPRTYVERTDDRFDVIDLALTAPYRPVNSGAYSLAEDYQLTVEAFEQYLDRLAPGGTLAAARWVQIPPSEEVRLLAVAAAALRNRGEVPAASVAMLRSYGQALVLVRPGGFIGSDLALIEEFARTERFDIVVAPGLEATNRFNVLPDEQYSRLAGALLATSGPERVYDTHSFDISPPTDDRPFFGHFFTWSQTAAVLETLGRTWQPFGGAGYFVLIALLAISGVAALALIAVPLLVRSGRGTQTSGGMRWWTIGYFSLLGVAFLFVEIPLIQQYILLLGRPTLAFAVVLFGILVSSGIGSARSRRVPWRPGAVMLTVLAVAFPLLLEPLTRWVLPASTTIRILVGLVVLFPLGFLMGIMFPRGLAHLEGRAAHLIPWAWAINGTVSVISAAGAALLALGYGFTFVVQLGAVAYGLAVLLTSRSSGRLTPRPG